MNTTQTDAIGILGGTFDPIHFGHLRMALDIQQAMGFKKIHMIPSSHPPHRTFYASANQRLAMLKLALKDTPELMSDDRELKRQGPSFTIDTLKSLREQYGSSTPICLILGMDQFANISTWYEWNKLVTLANLVIAPRPKSNTALDSGAEQLLNTQVGVPTKLITNPTGQLWVQPITTLDISSTQIRTLIQNRQSAKYLLPCSVLNYIEQNKLYL